MLGRNVVIEEGRTNPRPGGDRRGLPGGQGCGYPQRGSPPRERRPRRGDRDRRDLRRRLEARRERPAVPRRARLRALVGASRRVFGLRASRSTGAAAWTDLLPGGVHARLRAAMPRAGLRRVSRAWSRSGRLLCALWQCGAPPGPSIAAASARRSRLAFRPRAAVAYEGAARARRGVEGGGRASARLAAEVAAVVAEPCRRRHRRARAGRPGGASSGAVQPAEQLALELPRRWRIPACGVSSARVPRRGRSGGLPRGAARQRCGLSRHGREPRRGRPRRRRLHERRLRRRRRRRAPARRRAVSRRRDLRPTLRGGRDRRPAGEASHDPIDADTRSMRRLW